MEPAAGTNRESDKSGLCFWMQKTARQCDLVAGGFAPQELQAAVVERVRTWVLYRDPDFAHPEHVSRLSLELYDRLKTPGLLLEGTLPHARLLLQAAAFMRDVSFSRGRKKHRLASFKMIRKMDPPLGWSGEVLRQVAPIARFHRGSLPHPQRRVFAAIKGDVREAVLVLCGILRLTNAFDLDHRRKTRRLALKRKGNALILRVPGHIEDDAAAEKISAASHLLETACRLPIFIG